MTTCRRRGKTAEIVEGAVVQEIETPSVLDGEAGAGVEPTTRNRPSRQKGAGALAQAGPPGRVRRVNRSSHARAKTASGTKPRTSRAKKSAVEG